MEGKKKKAGIVCCSNGMKRSSEQMLIHLEDTLMEVGIEPVFSKYIFENNGISSGTAQERADALMDFYKDDEIKEIFDISGGDIANGVLPYLDYNVIKETDKMFWGYSDLTTILNAIYAITGKASVLYQIRNLIYDHRDRQIEDFRDVTWNQGHSLFHFDYKFIQGKEMHGAVIGGNIRCFLKLAGTEYMPDFKEKILFLESRSGLTTQMETFLSQLQQLGAFDKVKGILLGTFTQMERELGPSMIETLIKRYVKEDMPIAVTGEIGHGTDSKGLIIGQELYLR